MKGFMHDDDTLTLTAPSGGVTSGVGYMIGGLFVVAQSTHLVGEKFGAISEGVVELPKSTTATSHAEGDHVYWDNVNKLVKLSATGYFPIGVAVKSTVNSDTVVRVKLDNVYATAVP
jgi:predicted RecA/RadA family phage recombinase